VSARSRLIAYGTAALAVVVGFVVAALDSGTFSDAVAIVLISLGFGGALLLLFYEVGLSEDRARAREEEEKEQRRADRSTSRRGWPSARDRATRRRS
jgi:hypothetical protein